MTGRLWPPCMRQVFHPAPEDQRRAFPVFRARALPGAGSTITRDTHQGMVIGHFSGHPPYRARLDTTEDRQLAEQNGFGVLSHHVAAPNAMPSRRVDATKVASSAHT